MADGEFAELIDELVAKRGPRTGYIKANQDPIKVARLLELGYNEPVSIDETISAAELTDSQIKKRLEALEAIVADHEKRIKECSIRR